MTRLRKLAIKISDTVVRRSRPSYKDWALATRSELDFIQGDWAALRWALGSWKLASSCQNAPLTTLSEVPRAAQRFLRETRVSTLVTWFSLLWVSYWFSGVFHHSVTVGHSRMGWCLLLATLVYIACEAITFRGWKSLRGTALPEVADTYRSALSHQRDLQSGVWYWSRIVLILAGPMLGAYHAWLLKPGAGREALFSANLLAGGIIAFAVIVSLPISRRTVARYQSTIDQLDALDTNTL
jgi:hypothetical protein